VVLILIAKKLLGKKEPAVDKDNVIELGHGLSYTMGEALEFLKSDRPADFDFGYSIFQNASEEQKYRLLDSLPRSKIQEIAAMDKGKTIVVTTIEEVQERPIKGIAITDRLKGTLVISIPDPASPYKFKVSVRGKETRTVSLEVPEKLVASDSGSYELEDGTAYSIRRLREGMEQNGFYSDAEDLIIIPINASDILGDEEFFTLKITCSGDDVWLELRDDNSYYGISVTYSRVVHRLEPRVDPSSKTVVTPGAARAAGAPISLGASMQELSKAMKQSASTTQTRPPGRGTKGRGKPQKSSSSGMRPAPISSINELDIENATLYRESDYVRLYKARDKVRGDEYIIKVYCGETSPKFQHATREIVSHLLWLSEQYSQLTDMPRCFEKGEIYLKGGRISQMAEGDGPYPYVIMDFVPGTDFLNIIAQLGFEKTDDQIGPRDVWSTKIKLLYSIGIDVLRYHRAGLLIKDLKPNNIILSPDATVRVADLKAAIPLRHDWQDDSAHQISKAIRIIHTELFAEDISIFDASTPNELDRSFLLFTEQWDIYSFGITAFALLAPEQYNSYTDPTRVTTAAEIKQNIRDYLDKYIAATDHLHDDDILRQSTIEAYRVIRRCIEQDREVRYQDMAAVLAAIRISIEILDATPTASHRAMPDTRHVVAAIASAA